MKTFVFLCPRTGFNVHGWVREDMPSDGDAFVTVECLSCGSSHRVNPMAEKERRRPK